MSRRKKQYKRKILPDLKYKSKTVAKFINQVMRKGKKSLAQKIVYSSLDLLEKKLKKNPLEIFSQAISNVAPLLEIKTRRIGGAHYQIPIEVRESRRITLAMRWILEAARKKKGKSMKEKLTNELIAAFKNEGDAVKKKENIHKLAEANKAFAHFA